MEALERYIRDEYQRDIYELKKIEDLISESTDTLLSAFNEKTAWPYEITKSGQRSPKKNASPSTSTTAMILLALEKLSNPKVQNRFKVISKLNENDLKNTKETAFRLINSEYINWEKFLVSGTYGVNDVFTLAWLAELYELSEEYRETSPISNDLHKMVSKKLKKKQKPEKLHTPNSQSGGDRLKPARHAFFTLRLIHAHKNLKPANKQTATSIEDDVVRSYFTCFENILHDHLSYSEITDSRFDPAELAFCLEGMLLCRVDSVDLAVIDRTMNILKKTQEHNAYWRPTKPTFVSDVGCSLFPVSVEVANSLLRSCSHINNGYGSRPGFITKHITLFHRYWKWIQSRVVRFTTIDNKNIVGWHSDNSDDPELIHLWETSQIIEFLLGYRTMLQGHIAETMLNGAKISKSWPKKKKDEETFDKIVKKFEPVTYLDKQYEIYNKIKKDFIEPRINGKNIKFYSMLLYGPPGTGKTKAAKNIAAALNWPLITITVSDFLAGGEAQIEARAKNIFETLKRQPQSVILFDEIDNFLLNRDSTRYRDQDTTFQFITPGMLTKLADLRDSKHSIFIVATNYEERIDPAIKRVGRIDKKYVLLLPDATRRKAMIEHIIKDGPVAALGNPPDQLTKIAEDAYFLSYGDLENILESFELKEASNQIDFLLKEVNNYSRLTSLEAYQPRIVDSNNKSISENEAPIEEFFCMLALRFERDITDEKLKPSEKSVITKFIESLNASSNQLDKRTLKEKANKLPDEIVYSLYDLLKKQKLVK